MPYMFYQQYATAIKEAYVDHDNIAELHAQAKAYREWLETLALEPHLLKPLVDPIDAIERAFRQLTVSSEE